MHTGSCVYRSLGEDPFPLFPLCTRHLLFRILWFDSNETSRWRRRKITSDTCAEQASAYTCLWALSVAELAEGGVSPWSRPPPNLCQQQDTLWGTSSLLGRKRNRIFSCPAYSFPSRHPPTPKKTAWIGQFGAVLLSTIPRWRDEHGAPGRRRSERTQRSEGGCIYRNIVIKKKEICWLLNITWKKCVVAFVLFLFDVIIIVHFWGWIFARWRSILFFFYYLF